jgi:hypothetical protein
MPVAGTPPLAHTGDQLRRVVPDGHEDLRRPRFRDGRLLAPSRCVVAAPSDGARSCSVRHAAAGRCLPRQHPAGPAAAIAARLLDTLIADRIVNHYTAA